MLKEEYHIRPQSSYAIDWSLSVLLLSEQSSAIPCTALHIWGICLFLWFTLSCKVQTAQPVKFWWGFLSACFLFGFWFFFFSLLFLAIAKERSTQLLPYLAWKNSVMRDLQVSIDFNPAVYQKASLFHPLIESWRNQVCLNKNLQGKV